MTIYHDFDVMFHGRDDEPTVQPLAQSCLTASIILLKVYFPAEELSKDFC